MPQPEGFIFAIVVTDMCGRVIQSSSPLRLAIVDGLKARLCRATCKEPLLPSAPLR